MQFWYGRDLAASGRPDEIADQLVVRLSAGGICSAISRTCGETVGIYAAAGNLRDSGNVIAKERTNIVLMPFCGQCEGQGVVGVRSVKSSKR